jgi:hypothetical protein
MDDYHLAIEELDGSISGSEVWEGQLPMISMKKACQHIHVLRNVLFSQTVLQNIYTIIYYATRLI